MKLFLIHCGYYDPSVNGGIYESHTDLFIAAEDFAGAKKTAKALPEFKRLKMHVDAMVEVATVQGFDIELRANGAAKGKTVLRHQGFAARTTRESEF